MPDRVPAPGSTATSASAFIFLTVSGVAATRGSAEPRSRATKMRIRAVSYVWRRNGPSARSVIGVVEQEQSRYRDHDEAHDARSGPPADAGDSDPANDHQGGRQPMAYDPTDCETEQDVDNHGGADEHHLDELAETGLVCGKIVAFRRGVLDFRVLGHEFLQLCRSLSIAWGLAQLREEGNVQRANPVPGFTRLSGGERRDRTGTVGRLATGSGLRPAR